jgi:hypothetical protein
VLLEVKNLVEVAVLSGQDPVQYTYQSSGLHSWLSMVMRGTLFDVQDEFHHCPKPLAFGITWLCPPHTVGCSSP